jgi:hypothetical protein
MYIFCFILSLETSQSAVWNVRFIKVDLHFKVTTFYLMEEINHVILKPF